MTKAAVVCFASLLRAVCTQFSESCQGKPRFRTCEILTLQLPCCRAWFALSELQPDTSRMEILF